MHNPKKGDHLEEQEHSARLEKHQRKNGKNLSIMERDVVLRYIPQAEEDHGRSNKGSQA